MPSTPHRSGHRTARWPAIALASSLLLLLVHVTLYRDFVADDALISLRYSARLLDGEGLTWTAGERVEGYSNLLWVLLTAGIGATGLDLVLALRLLGGLCGVVTLVALVAIGMERERGDAATPGELPWSWTWAVVPLGFALAGPTGVWTLAGLETPLVVALLACALAAVNANLEEPRARTRSAWLGSTALALLALTRPDGILFAFAIAAGVLAASVSAASSRTDVPANARLGGLLGRPARLLSLPLVALAGQLAFRRIYYHDWLPNTAYVKLGFTTQRLLEGAAYVGSGVLAMLPLSAAGLLGLVLACTDRRERPLAWILLAVGGSWSAYVAFVGGDVFPGYRHLAPLVVVLALGAGLGVSVVVRRGHGRLRAVPLGAAVAVFLVVTGIVQTSLPQFRRANDERWVWYGRDLALTLRHAFEDRDPLLAVTAAGCLPYWSGFRSLDMLGLCDAHIARNRPPDFGTGPLAHELGDPDYVLRREPDLVVFGAPGPGNGMAFGGRYREAFFHDARFNGRYKPVRLRVSPSGPVGPTPFDAYVWMRVDSPHVGFRNETNALVVPSWFFSGDGRAAAWLRDDRLVITIGPDAPGSVLLGRARRSIAALEVRPAAAATHVHAEVGQNENGDVFVTLRSDVPADVESVVLRFTPDEN